MHYSAPENLQPGDHVAEYRIERLLGRGAMAVVYRAIQINLERPIALKILPSELANNEEFVNRFFNEAKAAALFSHPNIVQAYDAGVADNSICYFAMEFVEGETLLDRINREKRLPPLPAVRIALAIARALSYGWKNQQLTHGDIKPANIMLTNRDETKLADFGLAKVSGLEAEEDEIMLTPLYAAPEVIQGHVERPDCRPDIYSLGATLYHMLTGTPPFPGDDSKEVLRAQVEDPLIPAVQRNPSLPKALSEILDRLLQKSPAARPQTWTAVIRALENLVDSLSRNVTVAKPTVEVHAAPAAGMRQRSGTTVVGKLPRQSRERGLGMKGLLLAALALIAIYIALWFWYQTRSGQKPSDPAPAQQQSQAAARVDNAWQRIQRRVSNTPDPADRLRLLELFSEKYPGIKSNQEFVATVRFAQAELKQQRRLAEQQQQQERDQATADKHAAAISQQQQEQEQQQEQQKQQEAAALAQEVSRTDDSDSQESQVREQTETQELSGDQLQKWNDAYIELLYGIRRFRYTLDKPVSELETMVGEWLAACPHQLDVRERVVFINTTILPALQDLRPALANHAEALAGLSLSNFKGVVRDVTRDGLEMAVHIDAGEDRGTAVMTHKISWSQLSHPRHGFDLTSQALAESRRPIEQQHPFLAFYSVLGAADTLQKTLTERQLIEDPEYRRWALIASDLSNAIQEYEALQMWRSAQELYQQDKQLEAYQLALKLQQLNAAVTARYAEKITILVHKTESRSPSHLMNTLLQQVQAQRETDPGAALEVLMLAKVRYGKLESVHHQKIEDLRLDILNHLVDQLLERGMPLTATSLFAPFVDLSTGTSYWKSAAEWHALERTQLIPERLTPLTVPLRKLAFLEMGDWAAGKEAVGSANPVAVHYLWPRLQLSFTYSRGLVAHRFMAPASEQRGVLKKLEAAWEQARDPMTKIATAAICGEYALVTEQYDEASTLNWPSLTELAPMVPPLYLKRYVLGQLALAIEAESLESAFQLSEQMAHNIKGPTESGFTEKEWALVQGYLSSVRSVDSPPPVPDVDLPSHPELFDRLALAAAMHAGTADARPQNARLWNPTALRGRGPVFGKTRFQVLLLKLGQAAEESSFEHFSTSIQEALTWQDADAAAYYPRLVILQAGSEIMNNRLHAARETLALLKLTTVANDNEQGLADFLADLKQISYLPTRVPEHPESGYWEAYLKVAYWLGKKDYETADKHVRHMQSCALTPVRTTFARQLQKLAPTAGKTHLPDAAQK